LRKLKAAAKSAGKQLYGRSFRTKSTRPDSTRHNRATPRVQHPQCSDCCWSPLSGIRSVSANKTTFSLAVGNARSVSDAR
jgi:hypothetical protein